MNEQNVKPNHDKMAGAIVSWQDDLSQIASTDWNYDRAAHLLERAGFGGTPEDIQALAAMSPSQAVGSLVYFDPSNNSHLHAFDHSGIHDPGIEPFPPSRPSEILPWVLGLFGVNIQIVY